MDSKMFKWLKVILFTPGLVTSGVITSGLLAAGLVHAQASPPAAPMIITPAPLTTYDVYTVNAFENFQQQAVRNEKYPKVELLKNDTHGLLKTLKPATPIDKSLLAGESDYLGFIIVGHPPAKRVSITVAPPAGTPVAGISVTANIVGKWYQAGRGVEKDPKYKYLTYELLVKSDEIDFKDSWVKKGEKWYYAPPKIETTGAARAEIKDGKDLRLLVNIATAASAKAGTYRYSLEIKEDASGVIERFPINIQVAAQKIDFTYADQKSRIIYSNLALDPKVGRDRSYINNQAYDGDAAYQKRMYQAAAKDMKAHGFNGAVITDWRKTYLAQALDVLKSSGLKNVIIYATSPVSSAESDGREIVTQENISLIKSYGFEPFFYGYDEPGGNEKLTDQTTLNQRINSLGAKPINGMWWKDRTATLNATKSPSHSFSAIAYSLGSNGQQLLFSSLPMAKTDTTNQLVYWHPNVEDPAVNRMLSGFWLWASKLDGIMPHPYLFLPHVARLENAADIKYTSPYNDFGFWQPPDTFRQHASVYPIQEGYLSTLQWEALRAGYEDYALVSMVENTKNTAASKKLLDEIRTESLKIKTSGFSDSMQLDYVVKANQWRNDLRNILLTQ
jgi:hypothetical protein